MRVSMDFSAFFHRSSKDLLGGGTVYIPHDDTQWPVEWKTAYYKAYPRFPKIALPTSESSADFFELMRVRKSQRDFSRQALSPEKLSTLLKYSGGLIEEFTDNNPRRAQPSGGGRYPLEIYPILFNPAGEIPAGVYHYNVKEHALDSLWERPFTAEDIAKLAAYEWVQKSSGLIVITAMFWRSQAKYGERGYRYILLEAGHLGQNIYLASTALGLKCTGLGGTLDYSIESLLDIDGVTESVVYGLVIG